jgi:ATP-dependent Clp protease ATP-binding subunit ClpA
MFERFVRDAKYAALEATSVAAGLGSGTIEAEHLLISISSGKSKAAYALRDVGLEPQELRDAIQRDFERSLAKVGIDVSGVDIPANCRRTKPRWGTSAKQGMERAVVEAKRRGDKKIGCEHLLRGLLAAEHGTVPRVLAAEGIDRDELTGRL